MRGCTSSMNSLIKSEYGLKVLIDKTILSLTIITDQNIGAASIASNRIILIFQFIDCLVSLYNMLNIIFYINAEM